jgi:hypothetical protein
MRSLSACSWTTSTALCLDWVGFSCVAEVASAVHTSIAALDFEIFSIAEY